MPKDLSFSSDSKVKRSNRVLVKQEDESQLKSRLVATGTTPKIQSSATGSMLLAIPGTPNHETCKESFFERKSDVTVLEEEEYISKLENIIGRDFFPRIQEMQNRISMIDYMLLHGEVPIFTDSAEKEELLTLTKFQEKHTSEDNSSFAELMKTQSKALRAKYPWLWNNESNGKTSRLLENGKSASKQPIELVARMTPRIEEENRVRALKLGWTDERETNLNTWKVSGRGNNLMGYPNSFESTITEKQQKIHSAKKIQYSQTRFDEAESVQSSNMTFQSEKVNGFSGSANSAQTSVSLPEVDGYSFVTENTYRRSQDEDHLSHRSFTMAKPNHREEVHNKLLDHKMALRKQEKTHPMGTGKGSIIVSKRAGSRVTKTPLNGSLRDVAIPLSPAGSHILSSLKRKPNSFSASQSMRRSSTPIASPRRFSDTKPKSRK